MFVVAGILFGALLVFQRLTPKEVIGAVAVLLTFGHAQIGTRLAEAEGARSAPQVACHHKLAWYFSGREICWAVYFVWGHAYSAIVGVGVFLLYPLWRRIYRRHYPMGRTASANA